MTQNIYDRPDFFDAYGGLPRSVDGLSAAPEWPVMRSLLPPLDGRRVVDLGCGYGWFCRFAAGKGAQVLGLDVSERMLARARSEPHPRIAYERADLEKLDLPPARFDLAYSSLALHYVEAIGDLVAGVHRALVPGGRFVFSMEHPVFTAPTRPGWSVDGEGRRTWPLDGYFAEGPRVTDWLTKGVVKRHRTTATMLGLLIRAGFAIRAVEEFGPSEAQVAAEPDLAPERERPAFLIVASER